MLFSSISRLIQVVLGRDSLTAPHRSQKWQRRKYPAAFQDNIFVTPTLIAVVPHHGSSKLGRLHGFNYLYDN